MAGERGREGAGVEGKVGQRWDGRGRITHGFLLLQVECGDVEGARPRLFPIHRHHAPIVTGQSVPDSVEEEGSIKSCQTTFQSKKQNYTDIIKVQFTHHRESYSACKNSCILSSVALEKITKNKSDFRKLKRSIMMSETTNLKQKERQLWYKLRHGV